MTVSVLVTPRDGRYFASVLGSPEVTAAGDSEDAAVSALKAELDNRHQAGQIVLIDLAPAPLSRKRRPYTAEEKAILDEIVAEAYRLRDEEKAREFPE
jgi:predicted RNase H-like HicB family nuclease